LHGFKLQYSWPRCEYWEEDSIRDFVSYLERPLFLFAALGLTVILCPPAYASGTDTESNAATSIGMDARLTVFDSNSMVEEMSGPCYQFEFGWDGEAVPLQGVSTPQAMRSAAALYAIQTGAGSVTIENLLASGYWPFNSLDPASDRQQQVSNTAEPIVLPGTLVTEVGDSDWKLRARDYILGAFYNEYYYFGSLEAQDAQANVPVVPPRDLKPVAEFWISPVSGESFAYGELKGDIHECPMSDYFVGPDCLLSDEIAEHSNLILINTSDLVPSPFRQNGKITH
jgi:hypothetical protein